MAGLEGRGKFRRDYRRGICTRGAILVERKKGRFRRRRQI